MPQRRERVVPRLIEDEMRESFINYSMSVIVQRALPDVRDGLKPVHRRILYAMHELGLSPGRPYKKSAAVVGEVLGKYHPHGDMAVYDSLVRMVQDFSLRYPLVDGQGNFGSIDGDNAAAYRYTEARLAPPAMELLADIEKETVDFVDTFDGQRQEPKVLPAKLPNLLVNGSSGIAVGMATNIPPHNLREVAAALRHLVEHPDCTVDDLIRHLPGPDFPTGAFILGVEGIHEAYRTGRGRMIMRARVQKEAKRGGKEQLVVTELPYGISKARVVEQIAELVRTRKTDDIADLRDESDRDGMRIVIELKRGAKAKPVLNLLYKQTYLQATFGAIMLALDNGVPRELTLKEFLERYRDHRLDVIRRRSTHELEKARAEAHVIEGLLIALDNIDAVIGIIRKAKDREDASAKLRKRFELSEPQADAILNMRLAKLTALETRELRDRLKELEKQIAELETLLKSEKKQLRLLLSEVDALVEKYGDARRTTILKGGAEDFSIEDLVAQEEVVLTVSHAGYIKRIPISLYRRRVSSGKAVAGMDRYEDDFLEHVFIASTHDTLLFFTDDGQAYALPVHQVPEAGRSSRGRPLGQLLGVKREQYIAAMVAISDFSAPRSLVFLTASGTVKRTPLDQFANARSAGIIAIRLARGDRLLDVQLSDGTNDIVLVTKQGQAIRFPETEVAPMGRAAQGVKGIRLRPGDEVVGLVVVRREATLCTISEQGYAKRTPVADYPVQRRGGIGTSTLKVTPATGALVAAKELVPGDELMILTGTGRATRVRAKDVPLQGRTTQGKQLLVPVKGDAVVEVARVARDRGEERAAGKAETAREAPLEMVAAAGE
ncbi:MAG TPA: DNA gyrase subunit A [Longimicrobiales bacterium]